MQTMHLFAGIGGGLLADRILGHDPIIAVEWDRYACQVLRERAADGWFPNLQVWDGDVRLFDPSEYAGKVDCIHAGFPCQDISVAGNQAGVGEETRSGLYREVLRIAGVVQPRYLFLENVAAIVSNGLGTVLNNLAALGYDSEWLCLRASDCGAAHHRDRWWLLAYSTQLQRDGGNDNAGISMEEFKVSESGNCCRDENVAYADSTRCEGYRNSAKRRKEKHSESGISNWWEIESAVGRVVNGVPNRFLRLKGLGNAQVPLQAAVAFKLLMDRHA